MEMIRGLHQQLGIPAQILIQPYPYDAKFSLMVLELNNIRTRNFSLENELHQF
ncbi:hypothetical protein [Komarekiella delphini-convector]|uniref:hypothetical protein n=1 Tax=Komarekiella delphini-convector TaxID=3050158 RepID=UPI001CD83C27|nr:hypothetical protein [Komarekiella delphini-convector]